MLSRFFSQFYRKHLRNPISFLNIAALSIGFGASLLILGYLSFELSYDKFHSKGDRIYRAIWEYGDDAFTTRLQPIVGELLPETIEPIVAATRFFEQGMTVSPSEDPGKVFTEDEFLYTDNTILDIFDFEVYRGTVASFREPYSALITESTARKYFGDYNPIGQVINVTNMFGTGIQYTVRGVLQDVPANSHLQFDALLSNERLFSQDLSYMNINSWGAFPTYLLLKDAKDKEFTEEQIAEAVKKYSDSADGKISLQSLTDIHLRSGDFEESNSSINRILVLGIIAMIILILAWFNYVTLSTARSLEHAKEVGVRKILGSANSQIMLQFLKDTIAVNFIALILGLGIMQLTSKGFSYFTGLNLDPFYNQNFSLFLLFTLIFSLGTIISGLVPSLTFSRFKVMEIVHGKLKHSRKGVWMRWGLIGLQFTISVVLLVVTATIFRQVQFMSNESAGVNITGTLIVSAPTLRGDQFNRNLEAFSNELKQVEGFQGLSISNSVPGMGYNYTTNLQNPTDEQVREVRVTMIDDRYIDHYDIELLTGNNFNAEMQNGNNVIVNQKVLDLLQIDILEAVGKTIIVGNSEKEIVGVIENYHHRSMHDPYEPIAFEYGQVGNNIAMRINKGEEKQSLEIIEDAYSKYFPGNPFDYVFLDDYFSTYYVSDWQTGRLMTFFTLIALIIAGMGLYGYSTLVLVQRTKEVGIRKVLGASSIDTAYILVRDFLVVIALSVCIAYPIGYWLSKAFLSQYAFQAQISFLIFLIPLLVVTMVLAVTVSAQVYKTLITNPVESLRYE